MPGWLVACESPCGELDLITQTVHLGVEVRLLQWAYSQDPAVQPDNGSIPGLLKQYLDLRRIAGQAHSDLRDDSIGPDFVDVPPDC